MKSPISHLERRFCGAFRSVSTEEMIFPPTVGFMLFPFKLINEMALDNTALFKRPNQHS